jgi:hypothetical protein
VCTSVHTFDFRLVKTKQLKMATCKKDIDNSHFSTESASLLLGKKKKIYQIGNTPILKISHRIRFESLMDAGMKITLFCNIIGYF